MQVKEFVDSFTDIFETLGSIVLFTFVRNVIADSITQNVIDKTVDK